MNIRSIIFKPLFLLCFVGIIGTIYAQQKKARFSLPTLPYAYNALAPVISERTVRLHHDKHLKGYIDKLNELIVGTRFENADLETIVKESDGDIYNQAGQTLNHMIYFNTFSPNGKRTPTGKLMTMINNEWGSFDNFKKAFNEAGNTLFGSGWVWLAQNENGKLHIMKMSNAGNPLKEGHNPLLGIDVWEHAYYLDYENNKKDHLEKVWSIIDWEIVEGRVK